MMRNRAASSSRAAQPAVSITAAGTSSLSTRQICSMHAAAAHAHAHAHAHAPGRWH